MTDDQPTEDSASPWRWPVEWSRDESFWRDVTARSLATMLAGGLAYLFALGAGYVSRPETVEVVRGILIALTPIAIVLLAYSAFRFLLHKLPGRIRLVIACALVPILGVLVWLLSDAISSWISDL